MRLLGIVLSVLLFCQPAGAQEKLKVIASFSVLADIVGQIGGERVAVRTLVPAMGDAHVFQPSPSDARAVAGADLLVSNGLNFETWLDRLIAASGYKGHRVVAAEGIRPRRMARHRHDHGGGHDDDAGAVEDPHVWQDLQRMPAYIANIAEGLAAADPPHAEHYRARGRAYIDELRMLDAWAEAQLAAVPEVRRRAITQHDAFGYLADRYGITFYTAQGMTTEAEASAGGIAELLRQIRRNRVRAIFLESGLNQRLIEQVAKDAGAKVGGRLYSDTLSPPGGEADSYIRMYRLNITRLAEAMRLD